MSWSLNSDLYEGFTGKSYGNTISDTGREQILQLIYVTYINLVLYYWISFKKETPKFVVDQM